MAATIKDIARRLSISVSTVSYALNDGPRTVDPQVKQRILEVAREINYRPNSVAKSLVTRRSRTIGIVPERPSHNIVLGAYLQLVLNGVMNKCEDLQHDVLIFSQHGNAPTKKFVDMLLDGRCDGLIFVGGAALGDVLREAQGYGIPHVTIGGPGATDSTSILMDNRAGVWLAMEHLYALGHRKIGMVTGISSHTDSIEREHAFREWLSERSMEVREAWIVSGGFTQPGAESVTEQLLDLPEKPTAVVAANDEMAVGFIRTALRMGYQIPDDISVVGFDDTQLALTVRPELTTVRQPIGQMGEFAVATLVSIIEKGVIPPSEKFVPELIVRSSTSAPTEEHIP